MKLTDDIYKIGKCKWCRSDGEVYRDNSLCEECDSRTVYCLVCRERSHEDYACRHVFKSDDCGWHGSGYDPSDKDMMRPFHRLLSVMGEDFARDLKSAIKSGKFHTWMVAPMIGSGGMLTLYGMPSEIRRDYEDRLVELGQSERADELHDGYRWLVSLYDRSTTKANRSTIEWIDRWLWPFAAPSALSSPVL
jgi:hypothetical protein